jgi:hypothetical protein
MTRRPIGEVAMSGAERSRRYRRRQRLPGRFEAAHQLLDQLWDAVLGAAPADATKEARALIEQAIGLLHDAETSLHSVTHS